MPKGTQISAYISDEENARLDMFVRETGIKKGRVVEDAISAHLDAMADLPTDVMVPRRIVLSDDSFDRLVGRLEQPDPPAEALRKLLSDRG